MSELEGVSESLRDVWADLRAVLVECSLFVERKAAEGDPEALMLAESLGDARLWLTLENARAKTALAEFELDRGNFQNTD